MTSSNSTNTNHTKNPISTLLGVVVGGAIVIGLGALVYWQVSSRPKYESRHDASEEASNERIRPVAQPAVPNLAATGPAVPRTGEQLFNQTCNACHGSGAMGAPKVGDNAAWAPRIASGLDALINSAEKGKGSMPAQGGGATRYEIARAVVYMTGKSGGSFKEPEAPKDAPKPEETKK